MIIRTLFGAFFLKTRGIILGVIFMLRNEDKLATVWANEWTGAERNKYEKV